MKKLLFLLSLLLALPAQAQQSLIGSNSPTYSVNSNGGNLGYATPQDLVCIKGSGTRTVQVTAFSLFIQSTAAALGTVQWVMRSTADTGGTFTTPTIARHDLLDPAGTAEVDVYTALPTPGTSAGTLRFVTAMTAATTTPPTAFSLVANEPGMWSTTTFQSPITLRGPAQELCANWNGAAIPAGFTYGYLVEWEEGSW